MPLTCADIDKARALLGYHPRVKISEGIPKFIDWYLKQQKAMTVADLLRELIRIPSVNPDGDPGTTHTGEKECAKFVADFLRSCGAEAWLEDVLPDRPNVLGRFPSPGKRSHGFSSHRIPTP